MRFGVSLSVSIWALAGMSVAHAQAPAPPAGPADPAGSAQTPPRPAAPAATPEEEEAEVTVIGQRPFGSTIGNVRPEQELSQADIRSYGVSSVAELITELGPQTNAAAGPPVVLLNGKRISSFAEIRDIPPEAIQRAEILPEDVSLSYGYAANQKVVNIVLRRRFNAITGEVQGGTTTEGGRSTGRASANLLTIRNGGRLSLDGRYDRAGRLLESQRDIVAAAPSSPFSLDGNVTAPPGAASSEIDPALSAAAGRTVTVAAVPPGVAGRPGIAQFVPGANAPGVSDLGRYRTLAPATENLSLNAVYARPLSQKVQMSVNGRLEFTGSDALQGLPGVSLAVPAGNPFSPFANPVQLYRYTDVAGPLAQRVRGDTQHLGATVNGELKNDWLWSFTANYDRAVSRTATQRGLDSAALQAAIAGGSATANPFGPLAATAFGPTLTDQARSRSSSLTGDLLLSGPLFSLPAGRVQTSVTISGATNDFASSSLRSGIARETSFSRDIAGVRGSVDLPIASRRNQVLTALGDLALNANAAVQRLSDAGTLSTIGYGVRWSPIAPLRFIGSVTHDRNAATGQQINDPLVTTPNVPVFDYRTGQTVFVSQIGGGNPALLDSRQRRIRLQMTAKPFAERDLTLTATFNDTRTDNPIAAFPVPTPQVEAAFPGRFIRDPVGRLVQIDSRPINFASSRQTELRWGFNFSKPLKSGLQKKIEAWREAGAKAADRPAELDAIRDIFQRERARAMRQRGDRATQPGEPTPANPGEPRPATDGQPPERRDGGDGGHAPGAHGPGGFGGGGGGGGHGGGGFGGGRDGGGRLQFALFHTWRLTDTITVAPGVPRLDLLDGAATGSTGGRPRNEIEAQAGYSNNGIGLRLSGNWRSGTRVDGALGAAGGGSTLYFGGLATADLRVFVNFTQMPQLIRDVPFLRGSRLHFAVTNLFDAKPDVRDAAGVVPLRYQPDYLDPVGRRITLSFRKLFF